MKIIKKRDVIKKILILSDLHISSKDMIYDGKTIKWVTILNEFQKHFKDHKYDYVLFVGDLTDKNEINGYTNLISLANAAGVSVECIVSCPGNHDQFKKRINKIVNMIHGCIDDGLSYDVNSVITASILKNANINDTFYNEIKEIHDHKFENYITYWINVLYGELQHEQIKIRRKPGFTIDFGDLLITSINSSWFCDFPDRRISDDGHLILGMNYIKESMKIEGSENVNTNIELPRLTIMHHPPENFNWEEKHDHRDEVNTFKFLSKESSMIISGHVHGRVRTMGYDNSAILIYNGTSFNSSQAHIMSFTTLDLNCNNGDCDLKKYVISEGVKDKVKFEIEDTQQFTVPLIKKVTS